MMLRAKESWKPWVLPPQQRDLAHLPSSKQPEPPAKPDAAAAAGEGAEGAAGGEKQQQPEGEGEGAADKAAAKAAPAAPAAAAAAAAAAAGGDDEDELQEEDLFEMDEVRARLSVLRCAGRCALGAVQGTKGSAGRMLHAGCWILAHPAATRHPPRRTRRPSPALRQARRRQACRTGTSPS
jgi:hypothetical protein